jgi:hypothetical protein
MQPQQERKDGQENPIGLYKDPQSGTFIGAIEEVQADAFVQLGYKLVEAGREAATLSDKQIAKKYPDGPVNKPADKSSEKASK